MITIYIATHKEYNFPQDDRYIPIHVGKAKKNTLLPYIGDDSGDSISELNDNFCELTALYWLWKNCDSPLVGLVHYRRYFKHAKKITHVNYIPIARPDDFHELLNGHDLVIPKKLMFNNGLTVREHYGKMHRECDLDLTRTIILHHHPDYLSAFDAIMNEKEIFICNMFIAKKHILDSYSSWLFDILFRLRNEIDLSTYSDSYQKRVFGFISERLFNVWVEKNKSEINTSFREIINIPERTGFFHKVKYLFKKIKTYTA